MIRSKSLRTAGFTLLEFVVVLAVVGTLIALAIPAMRRSLAKSELRDAARQLRVVLTKARLAAIETGVVQTFCYQPGTSRFVLDSHALPTTDQDTESVGDQRTLDEPETQILADGVIFLDPQDKDSLPVADEDKSAESGESRIRVIDAKPVDQAPLWSRPVVFYPSGRASDARFRVLGQFDYYADLELRGLTGGVKLGEIQRPKTKDSLDREEDSREKADASSNRPSSQPDVSRELPPSAPAVSDVAPEPPKAAPDEPPEEARP